MNPILPGAIHQTMPAKLLENTSLAARTNP